MASAAPVFLRSPNTFLSSFYRFLVPDSSQILLSANISSGKSRPTTSPDFRIL